jgi:hypothetical protein
MNLVAKKQNHRLVNIDIIKFLSIIIMVINHMILILVDGSLNISQIIFFAYVPLCQMGFLFSSGYLMALSFDKKKFNKYIYRIALFVILFALMTWLAKEELISSGSILLNFALSTALGLFFLYRQKINELITFTVFLFGLDIVLQIFTINKITILDDMLANYSYPVNSFSLYFFLGILLFFYKDKFARWFNNKLAWLVTIVLLSVYSLLFFYGIHVNIYNYYQHLPILILASAHIGLYGFFAWENIRLPKFIHLPIIKIADALLYIYVIHYIVFFGLLRETGLTWWQLTIVLFIVILFSIGLQRTVRYSFRALFKSSAKI